MHLAPGALILITALVLGAAHSFQPDHLAAVSIFVSRRPSWRRALALGARWGLGHSITILVVGGALAVSGLRLPERFGSSVDRVVGATLVVLGLIALRRALRIHAHWHGHGGAAHWHLHSHARNAAHDHGHTALLGIGMLHGLAGTGALVVLLPATVIGSRSAALLYLATFGAGTVLSMSLFGAAAGWLFQVAAHRSTQVLRALATVAGVATTGVGLWWMLGNGW